MRRKHVMTTGENMAAAERLNSATIEQTRNRLKRWGCWLSQIEGIGTGATTMQYSERIGEVGQGREPTGCRQTLRRSG
ncbi:MAG: hypothetical protein ABW168_02665 [Sedimenticola sp.]